MPQARAVRLAFPATLRRLVRKAEPGQRRYDDIERVGHRAAVCGGVGERGDQVSEQQHGVRPAVRQHDGHGVRVARTHVDEVKAEPVDCCLELRPAGQARLGLAPVVVGTPMLDQPLQGRERRVLVPARASLVLGPARLLEATLQVRQRRVAGAVRERHECGVAGLCPNARCWRAPGGRRGRTKYRPPRDHAAGYSSLGYQSVPRPSGVRSSSVQSGVGSGAPCGSCPGS